MDRYAWFPILLHSQYTFSSGHQKWRRTSMDGDNRNYTRFSSQAKNIEYSLIDCIYFPYLTECLNKKPSKSVQICFFILLWWASLSSKMDWITFNMQVSSCKLYKSSKASLHNFTIPSFHNSSRKYLSLIQLTQNQVSELSVIYVLRLTYPHPSKTHNRCVSCIIAFSFYS